MSATLKNVYTDNLAELVKEYNNVIHKVIKMKPIRPV